MALELSPSDHVSELVISSLLITILLVLSLFVYRDFDAYLELGPGGTPPTWLGYLKIQFLSTLTLRDRYIFAPTSPSRHLRTGELREAHLPDRGQRPVTKGIAPQRQVTQRAEERLKRLLMERVEGLASKHRRTGMSCFEKHNPALFSLYPTESTCDGEICHVHPIDGSMHLTLHPADARLVLAKRWGERHPLARGRKFGLFLPETFMIIYAPRSESDIDILIKIIGAAACFVEGKQRARRMSDASKRSPAEAIAACPAWSKSAALG